MKKIFISLMLVLGLGLLSSCDMDKKPFGSIDETTAIRNLEDLSRFRTGVYTALRGMNAGAWITDKDLQTDQFHGLINNGNRGGEFANGLITTSTSDIESMFAGCYSRIATANYLIEKAGTLEASGEYKDGDLAAVKRYKAEGHFLRAFCYFFLADHFSQTYTQVADPAKEGTGAMLVTKYAPSGDISNYPSRSSLADTYALIESDLAAAYDGLVAFEQVDPSNVAPNAINLSSKAVAAMQARVALVKGDYETALAKAKEVIGCGTYTLATIAELENMWTNDESNEVIFRCFMSNTEGLASTGAAYTASTTETSADYIPTYSTLFLFEPTAVVDVRFSTYFKLWNLDVEGSTYQSYVFLKYPGNPALWTTTQNNYVNMPKVFRLAEMYLVAAEAAANIPGSTDDPNQYLNELRRNRIVSYVDESHSGTALMEKIMLERERELLGEGFRMSDLRRWNKGFQRSTSQYEAFGMNDVTVLAGRAMKYEKDDYRFTWPIPKTEMDANPNLKGQQNLGY